MVGNQNSLGFRAAIRETAKVYGMPSEEIGRMSARVVRQNAVLRFPDSPTDDQWLGRISRTLQLKAPWPEIVTQALRVQNHFRHLSVHCGGVVIVPDEIRRYVPVEFTVKKLPVIQWEKDQTEEAVVKIDRWEPFLAVSAMRWPLDIRVANRLRSWNPLTIDTQKCSARIRSACLIESPARYVSMNFGADASGRCATAMSSII